MNPVSRNLCAISEDISPFLGPSSPVFAVRYSVCLIMVYPRQAFLNDSSVFTSRAFSPSHLLKLKHFFAFNSLDCVLIFPLGSVAKMLLSSDTSQ